MCLRRSKRCVWADGGRAVPTLAVLGIPLHHACRKHVSLTLDDGKAFTLALMAITAAMKRITSSALRCPDNVQQAESQMAASELQKWRKQLRRALAARRPGAPVRRSCSNQRSHRVHQRDLSWVHSASSNDAKTAA